jgi:hypothetical protein
MVKVCRQIVGKDSRMPAVEAIDRMARVYGIAGQIEKLQIQKRNRICRVYTNRHHPTRTGTNPMAIYCDCGPT